MAESINEWYANASGRGRDFDSASAAAPDAA